MEAEIDEYIEVSVLFKSGLPKPIKFLWQNNIYRVKKTNFHWVSMTGSSKFLHYSIETSSGSTFEIELNTDNFKWKLKKAILF